MRILRGRSALRCVHQLAGRSSQFEDIEPGVRRILSTVREEGDRARLRGHHAEADRAPAGGRVAAQVRVEAPHVACAPGPVRGDAYDGAEQHDPVGDVHAKIPVNTPNRITTSTNHPNTNR